MSNDEIKPSESGGENVQYATANIGGARATRKQAREWVQAYLKEIPEVLAEYAQRKNLLSASLEEMPELLAECAQIQEKLTLLLETRAALRYLDDLLTATDALEGMYD